MGKEVKKGLCHQLGVGLCHQLGVGLYHQLGVGLYITGLVWAAITRCYIGEQMKYGVVTLNLGLSSGVSDYTYRWFSAVMDYYTKIRTFLEGDGDLDYIWAWRF